MCDSHKHVGARSTGPALHSGTPIARIEADIQGIESAARTSEVTKASVGKLLLNAGKRLLGL